MLSTGDLDGNVKRLKMKLRRINYVGQFDDASIRLGLPTSILPILNFILTKASRIVAKRISENGFELTGKTDAKFVQTVFKLCRDYFNLRPGLTIAQFLQEGFAERKVCLLLSVIERCRACHAEGKRKETIALGNHTVVKNSRPKITPMDGGKEIDGVPSTVIPQATMTCKVMVPQDDAASYLPLNVAQRSNLTSNSLDMLPRPLLQHKAHPLPPLAKPMKTGQTSDNHNGIREAGSCAALVKSRPRKPVLPISTEPHTASERRGGRDQWAPLKGNEGRQAQVSQLHVQMAEVKRELGHASKQWTTAHQDLSVQVSNLKVQVQRLEATLSGCICTKSYNKTNEQESHCYADKALAPDLPKSESVEVSQVRHISTGQPELADTSEHLLHTSTEAMIQRLQSKYQEALAFLQPSVG